MTTKYCRWCQAGYRDVDWNDFFVDAGRAHFITGSAEVMTGDRKPQPTKNRKSVERDAADPEDQEATSIEDFLHVEPQEATIDDVQQQ